MAMKPIVDGIERDHAGELAVLRLNVQDPESQPWMERYPFQYTPTFIFIDGQGQELWQRWIRKRWPQACLRFPDAAARL